MRCDYPGDVLCPAGLAWMVGAHHLERCLEQLDRAFCEVRLRVICARRNMFDLIVAHELLELFANNLRSDVAGDDGWCPE